MNKKIFLMCEELEVVTTQAADWVTYLGLGFQGITTVAMVVWGLAEIT